MHTLPDIDELIRQTRRYEFADGLVELQMGVILAILGASSQLAFSPVYMRLGLSLSEAFGTWAKWLAVSIVLLPALVALGTRPIIKSIRRRWLWRNSGFVKPLPSIVPRKTLVLASAIVVVSAAIGFVLSRAGWGDPMLSLRVLVVGMGWAQGVVMIGVGRATGLAHHGWFGVVGGPASTLFLFLPLTYGQALMAFCLLWGLAFAASGLISLRCALLTLRKAGQDG